ncbi:MAG: chromosome segregation protein SMC, partial [Clostridiales bacterium]|nr:chromosome segregation protein SMC [Clostridiales bacterium]
EVSLTIDNTDTEHRLPIDFNEVTITRRIFRSGESEYLMNKTTCRLKDITELFLDTGIGKDGYSVIGQGRVDEILSNRSEDRRLIFEEASGIMKYKVRKHEAEKKLELTRQNLSRINDIINELETQIEPLRLQSETAREFLDLREELKGLEVNVYLESLIKFKERLKEMEEQFNTIRDNIVEENNKLEEITNANRSKTDLLKNLDERMEKARQEFYGIEGNLERSSSEINLNNEKIKNLETNIQRMEAETAEFNAKIASLDKEEETKQTKLKYLQKQLDNYTESLLEYEKQMADLLKTLDAGERHIENLKASISDKQDLLSDKKMQMHNVRVHLEGIEKRKKTIDQEVYQQVIENDREFMKKEDLTTSIQHASGQIKKQKERKTELNAELDRSERSLAEIRGRENKLKSDLQYKTSRYRTLSEMEQNLEGYNRSVRNVLQECRDSKDFGSGIHGALAQLVKVDRKYESAIEMTLGSALQNIVTSTEEDAKKAIEFLKKNKMGRATFLPISSVTGKGFDAGMAGNISRQNGFCGVASELVSYDPAYERIMTSLLGRVVVVDNLDNAIAMARKFSFGFRIVTLDGDIMSTGGSMSGGSMENRGTGILGRGREIEELGKEMEKLKVEEKAIARDIEEMTACINDAKKELTSLEGDIKNNELIKVRDESHLAQVEENMARLGARIDMLKQEKVQLERQQLETDKEIQKYSSELAALEEEINAAKLTVSGAQDKHKEDQAIRDALHEDIMDFKISVNSIKESMDSVLESSDRINSEKEALEKSIGRRNSEKDRHQNEIKGLLDANEGMKVIIKKFEEEKTGRTLEIDRITEERKVLEEDLYDIVNKINDINKNTMMLQEDQNRLEVKKAKLEAETEAIQNRMWDEYELTYSSALELKKDIGSLPQAQKRINELKNRIKELGPVNVGAIEEYVKTKERFEFMSIQRNDMEQAAEKLQRVIYEMTSVMKKQFLEQLKLINENFSEVFRELFNGGRAQLILADPDNVLESGIEIEVQPPGKKLQNMMLLSGGERAFTAIALLFSILKLRPAPFCILDEVDAGIALGAPEMAKALSRISK